MSYLKRSFQIEQDYEKLKNKLYNSEYRRMMRIEKKYNGDRTKIQQELGFVLPLRSKRKRRTKAAKLSNSDIPEADLTTSETGKADSDENSAEGSRNAKTTAIDSTVATNTLAIDSTKSQSSHAMVCDAVHTELVPTVSVDTNSSNNTLSMEITNTVINTNEIVNNDGTEKNTTKPSNQPTNASVSNSAKASTTDFPVSGELNVDNNTKTVDASDNSTNNTSSVSMFFGGQPSISTNTTSNKTSEQRQTFMASNRTKGTSKGIQGT